jgi:hypothetical protein
MTRSFMARCFKVPAALLTLAAGGGCATLPAAERLTPAERGIACELTRGLGMGFGGVGWEQDGEAVERLSGWRETLVWKALPAQLPCPGGRRHLHTRGFGDYLNGFGLSADGRRAAISGGFQYAPLLGGSGDCYFERTGSEWRRIGCIETGAS